MEAAAQPKRRAAMFAVALLCFRPDDHLTTLGTSLPLVVLHVHLVTVWALHLDLCHLSLQSESPHHLNDEGNLHAKSLLPDLELARASFLLLLLTLKSTPLQFIRDLRVELVKTCLPLSGGILGDFEMVLQGLSPRHMPLGLTIWARFPLDHLPPNLRRAFAAQDLASGEGHLDRNLCPATIVLRVSDDPEGQATALVTIGAAIAKHTDDRHGFEAECLCSGLAAHNLGQVLQMSSLQTLFP